MVQRIESGFYLTIYAISNTGTRNSNLSRDHRNKGDKTREVVNIVVALLHTSVI